MNRDPSLLVAASGLCNRWLAWVSGAAIGLMMLVGAVDIVLTNIDLLGMDSRPVPGASELIATMMVIAVFLGVPLAQQRRGHIRVELFTQRLPLPLRKACALLASLLTAAMFAGIAWFGWKTAAHAWTVGEFAAGSFNLPLWPSRVALALGASVMVLQCLLDLLGEFIPALQSRRADTLPQFD